MPLRVTTIIGARPQFIKASAVSRAIGRTPEIQEEIIHTGQHFDHNMSESFFEELAMPNPFINLGINSGSHGEMTGKMLINIEQLFCDRSPECVLVYGDTNSTLAGALAAAKLGIPIAHVEAGLRSGLKTQPEEINRIITDRLSNLLFCPTRKAVTNLRDEGITNGVLHVGDVMYDVSQFVRSSMVNSEVLKYFDVQSKEYYLATVHRAENTDSRKQLESIIKYLKNNTNGKTVLMPLHPRTRDAIGKFGLDLRGITTCNPVSYTQMAALIFHAITVMTDSGGLQKEAYFHGVPCVTLRDQTEWTELVDGGWNRLWTEPTYKSRKVISDYGSGTAAQTIVNHLLEVFA